MEITGRRDNIYAALFEHKHNFPDDYEGRAPYLAALQELDWMKERLL